MPAAAAPGVERSFGWAPTDDPGQMGGTSPASIYSAGRAWSAAGFATMGHVISVNLTTGALSVSALDRTAPYHGGSFSVARSYDSQEQFAQADYLRTHPNTDPRPHFFGNWQLDQEAQVSATWDRAYGELLIGSGSAGGSLVYRSEPDFAVHTEDAGAVEERLRAFGVPGRTLDLLGWQFEPGDLLLKSRQGALSIVCGHYEAETLIDPVDLSLWRFEPMSGVGERYTSEYAYDQLIDVDGMRETNPPVVRSLTTDALGHTVAFQPLAAEPPYRAWALEDGAGRRYRLDLEQYLSYLDGNDPGNSAKAYVVTHVTDESAPQSAPIAYGYDDTGRLVTVDYPGQGGTTRRYTYAYDDRGALVSITDPVGDSLWFEYVEDDLDVDARLQSRLKVSRIFDGDANQIEYSYDFASSVTRVSMSGPGGEDRNVEIEYGEDTTDTHQRYITRQSVDVTRGVGAPQTVVVTSDYSDDGRFLLTQTVDPLGNTTQFEYNDYNQPTAVVDALGHSRELTYDVSAAPSAASPNRYDLVTTFEKSFDASGTPYDITVASEYLSYDGDSSSDAADTAQSTHRLSQRTDPLGQVWRYGYDDPADHLPLGPSRLTDPLANVKKRSYDDRGAVLTETDAVGNTWHWEYDPHGRLLATTDPNGHARHWLYDPSTGWLTTATDALGPAGDPAHSIRYEWNDAGQRVRDTDAVGAKTEYAYSAGKRLRAVTQHDSAARTTSFSFDVVGNLVELTDPAGNAFHVRYDEAGRVYELAQALGPPVRFSRDLAGRISAMTDRNGAVTTYEYDALARIVKLNEPAWPAAAPTNAGKEIDVTYDPQGRRLRVTDTDAVGPYVFGYDAAGKLRTRTDPDGAQLLYGYDARGALVHLTDGTGALDLGFTLDGDGRLLALRDSAFLDPARTFKYRHHLGGAVDNLYGIDYESGVATRFEYDADRQLTLAEHSLSGAPIASYGYDYRRDGLIGRETGTRSISYDYDGRKQLVKEGATRDGYDAAGNRTWRAHTAPPTASQATFDSENRMLTDEHGTTFHYDANGNLLRSAPAGGGTPTRYCYDGANRLRTVEHGSTRLRYGYDADSRMVERIRQHGSTTHERRYRYANRSILAELDATGKVDVLYTRDDEGRLLRRRARTALASAPSQDPHSLFYLCDGLGSVVRMLDWDGTEHLSREYEAWGQSTGSGDHGPFRYRSAFEDPDTHLLSFGARWYDAEAGRWVSQDPLLAVLGGSSADMLPHHGDLSNLYRYVLNNPLGAWDPTGLNPTLPKGWPQPPGWNGGRWWEARGKDKLIDPDGNSWHWHPEDETHNEHWDKEDKRGKKRRMSKDGKRDLGDEAFKPKPKPQEEGEQAPEKAEGDGNTRKRVAEGARDAAIGVGAGVVLWEIAKWTVAALAAPETGGASLAVAAATP